jgi:ribosomal protein S18 acetylase RimI-like enzyme
MHDTVRLEELGMNVWPALHQQLCNGWVIRLSNGYTKRANSASPLYHTDAPLEAQIARCEQFYSAQHLPTVIKLTSTHAPAGLDQLLEQRGYHVLDLSSLMTCDLRHASFEQAEPSALRLDLKIEDWLACYERLNQISSAHRSAHRAILDNILGQRTFCAWEQDGAVVGCGLLVREGEWVCLSDVAVEPQLRGQGIGTRMLATIMQLGREQGATYAFLQVIANNAPAQHIYSRFGFREAYRYWYRVAPFKQT